MSSEKRAQRINEVQENRKDFRRLNRDVIAGIRKVEEITVEARNGETYNLQIHPLSELHITESAANRGLDLADLEVKSCNSPKCKTAIKWEQPGKPTYYYCDVHKPESTTVTRFKDPLAPKKLRFMIDCVADALVEDQAKRLTAEELDEAIDAKELSRVFKRIMDLTKPKEEVLDKFPGKPT